MTKGSSSASKTAPAQTDEPRARSGRAPTADFAGPRTPLVADVKAASNRRGIKRPARGSKTKGEPEAVSQAGGPAWEIAFQPGAYQLTYSAQKLLEKIAAAAAARPQEHLRITGHSNDSESDGAALTGHRAKMVAGILVNRYQLNSKRIFINSVGPGGGAKVGIELGRNE